MLTPKRSQKTLNIPKSIRIGTRKDEVVLNANYSDDCLNIDGKQYGQPKIKILHQWVQSEALQKHPITNLFAAYSEFAKIVFVNRNDYDQKYKTILP